MFAHIVSPPTGGMTTAFRIEARGGRATNVTSVCHTLAQRARLGIEFEHVRVAPQRRHGGVGHRRRAEAAGERDVRFRVEELAPEKSTLCSTSAAAIAAIVSSSTDSASISVDRPRQVEVTDLGADTAGQGFDVEFGCGGDGVHASSLSPLLRKPD